MPIKHDIEEEEKDAEHYESESHSRPRFKKTYKKLSKDERGHKAKLEAIKKKMK